MGIPTAHLLSQVDCLQMEENPMNPLVALMQQSLDEYSRMLELLKSLQQKINSHTSQNSIEKFNKEFSALQEQNRETDTRLYKLLAGEGVSESIGVQLDLKKNLQQDILDLLKKTVPRANNAKTLMASEIRAIKNGRKALSGYRSQVPHQGKIVNKSL